MIMCPPSDIGGLEVMTAIRDIRCPRGRPVAARGQACGNSLPSLAGGLFAARGQACGNSLPSLAGGLFAARGQACGNSLPSLAGGLFAARGQACGNSLPSLAGLWSPGNLVGTHSMSIGFTRTPRKRVSCESPWKIGMKPELVEIDAVHTGHCP